MFSAPGLFGRLGFGAQYCALGLFGLVLALFAQTARAQGQPGAAANLRPFVTDAAFEVFLEGEARRQEEARRQATEARCPSSQWVAIADSTVHPSRTGAIVKGVIVEKSTGEQIPGAQVAMQRLEGALPQSSDGALSDVNGAFQLALDAETVAQQPSIDLRVSSVGFGTFVFRLQLVQGIIYDLRLSLCETEVTAEEFVSSSTGDAAAETSITNVQHQGVDEGGIVKAHGQYLVVLRRGRLFTVDVGGDRLLPVDVEDAFGPEVDPRGAWYDEMLIIGDVVVVVGYSYRREGTELILFRIDEKGQLHYGSTYHLRSGDYYSARNYASRVVGKRLLFHSSFELDLLSTHRARSGRKVPLRDWLPGLRRWRGDSTDAGFQRILESGSIFRPLHPIPATETALHTVTSCSVDDAELACVATAVVGPFDHTFYVSPTAVYVWLSEWERTPEGQASSVLYRLPHDGTPPGAVTVMGEPIDQFSFLESEDGHLNAVVGNTPGGQWMWRTERPRRHLALLRAPLTAFTHDGTGVAPNAWYRPLPKVEGRMQNRFIGDHLVYGSASSPRSLLADLAAAATGHKVSIVDWRTGAATSVRLPHPAGRIEALGEDAVVVGQHGRDLHFSALRLGARTTLAGSYVLQRAGQGESRSHGFFYRADGEETGVLGLPVLRGSNGDEEPWEAHGAASIVFVRNRALALLPLGALTARPQANSNDTCRASCVDWYGNARPIFLRGRVFALMGYELVEGRLVRGRMREVRRVLLLASPSSEPRRPGDTD